MKLAKKKSFDDWIEVEEGISFLIDYPTVEQNRELQKFTIKNANALTELAEGSEDTANYWSGFEYMSLYLKYTIKDWKENVDGKDHKGMFADDELYSCELKDGALTDELLHMLTGDIEQTTNLFNIIYSELEVTEGDQQK